MRFLTNIMVRESTFNEQAQQSLPLRGFILEEFILTEENMLTPDDINNIVEDTNDEDTDNLQKVNVYTLQSKVATHLGSKDALDFLTEYLDADDQHLGIDQVALYVDYLWDQNWNVVLGFYSI